jgi:hypothetical protein
MNEERNPSNVSLSSRAPVPIFLIFLILLFFALGVYLILADNKVGWIMAIVSAILVPALILYRAKSIFTLNLAYGGFSIANAGHSSSFIWSDIERFAVSGDRSSRYVSFTLSPSGRRRCSSRDVFLVTSNGAAPRIPNNFGLSAEKLCELLDEWLQKGRGR